MRGIGPVYIDVAASIIADISSGIYRTPANALKELISNSFDVGATEVFVNTGYSNFNVFTCSDNGKGMPVNDFVWSMQHIGGSLKRSAGDVGDFGRPIIGKLGIGILAVSQICKEFTIESSNGSGEKFEATIDLSAFETIEAAKKQLGKDKEPTIRIGSFEPIVYREKKGKHYTNIILKDIEEGYRKSLVRDFDLPHFRQSIANPQAFTDFVKNVAEARRGLSQFSEYDRLIWELSLVAPVKYLEEGPVVSYDVIPQIREQLKKYNFKLVVDGLELRKPILLPLDADIKQKGSDFDFVPIHYDKMVEGLPPSRARLKFDGYIYFQKSAIKPPELRGVLIRIRNVAIGYYDKSLLRFPFPIGPPANQVSAEIYIEIGLESALNIDRNSFRETDLHYLALQDAIFEVLAGRREDLRKTKKREIPLDKMPVFDKIRLYSRLRRKIEVKEKGKEYLIHLQGHLKKVLKKNISIEILDEIGKSPVEIQKDSNVVIFDKNPIWPEKQAELNIYRKLLVIKELSKHFSKTPQEAKEIFLELLKKSTK